MQDKLSYRNGRFNARPCLGLGYGPLDTSFFKTGEGKLFIARIKWCEPAAEIDGFIDALDETIFAESPELELSFASSDLILFDSAEDGVEPDKKSVTASVAPGRYKILTQTYEPDALTSLVLYRFDKIA